MRSYIVQGPDEESIDSILELEEVTTGYRAKYVPLIEIQTELELEEIQELLPEYHITEQKEYHTE